MNRLIGFVRLEKYFVEGKTIRVCNEVLNEKGRDIFL